MIAKYVMQYRARNSDIWHERDIEEDVTSEGYKEMALAYREMVIKFPGDIPRVILRVELPIPFEIQQSDHDQS